MHATFAEEHGIPDDVFAPKITLDMLFDVTGAVADLPSHVERHLSPGQSLAHTGETPSCVFVVNYVSTKANQPVGSGPANIHYSSFAPEIVGLAEALAERPLLHDIVTSTHCVVQIIDIRDLLHYFSTHPRTLERAVRLMAALVRHARLAVRTA